MRAFGVLLFVSLGILVFSQIKLVKRMEFEPGEDGKRLIDEFHFGKKGLVLYFGTEHGYEFVKYDTDLNVTNTQPFVVNDRYSNYTLVKDDFLYFLSRDKKKGAFTLCKMSPDDLHVTASKGFFPPKSYIYEWTIINNTAIFQVKVGKRQFAILTFNMNNGQMKSYNVDDFIAKKFAVTDLEVLNHPSEPEVHVVYEENYDRGMYDYHIFRFNKKGELIGGKPMVIHNSGDSYITSFSLTKRKDRSGYLLGGTSSESNKASSNGIVLGKISNTGAMERMSYTNYLDLKDFLSYLSEKQQGKIERKKERKSEKGKELKLNYRCATHDIEERNGKYYFIGEFYYPTYRTETYTTYVNGQPVTHTRQVFDGYRYTHAMIASFDENANLLWCETTELYVGYKPMSVRRFIRSAYDDNSVKLVYTSGSKVRTVKYSLNGGSGEKTSVSYIETEDDTDDVKYTVGSSIMPWYDDYYILSGYQKIKNAEDRRKKRKVHFVSKLR